jgi:SRR1
MNDDNNPDEWIVVTARDKKRVMRKRGVRRTARITEPPPQTSSGCNKDNHHHVLPHDPAAPTTTAGGLDTIESIDECVKECIQYLCHTTSDNHGLWRTTMDALNDSDLLFSTTRIDEMICLGIGNFSKGHPTYLEAPLWQVSFALALQDELKCSKVSFFDPVALPIEKEYLRQKHPGCFTVLETNDRGRYKPQPGRALFFLPHCPRRLYENILRENWGRADVDLWLIGNSLERLAESCDFMPCTRLLLPFCTITPLRSTKHELQRAPGNLEGAFNDTYLCWIKTRSVPWSELECPLFGNDDEVENTIDCELL